MEWLGYIPVIGVTIGIVFIMAKVLSSWPELRSGFKGE